jgi:hypothetical protein
LIENISRQHQPVQRIVLMEIMNVSHGRVGC